MQLVTSWDTEFVMWHIDWFQREVQKLLDKQQNQYNNVGLPQNHAKEYNAHLEMSILVFDL